MLFYSLSFYAKVKIIIEIKKERKKERMDLVNLRSHTHNARINNCEC